MSVVALPEPVDRPEADVVVYDGQCRFCRRQVGLLNRLDRGQRLAYLSLHDPRVAERYPELSHDQMMREMYVMTPQHRAYGGAVALRYLSRRLPTLWWLAPLLHLPGSLPLWSFLYRQVAGVRYRLMGRPSCDNDACRVHLR
jgi:predicted DCC family thiol-disulfide oxidoreductase YuxK